MPAPSARHSRWNAPSSDRTAVEPSGGSAAGAVSVRLRRAPATIAPMVSSTSPTSSSLDGSGAPASTANLARP